MTMLIRGGTVHTMSLQGTLVGDVLMEGGCIAAIGPRIDLPEEVCTLSAAGLHVLPGLIDLCLRRWMDDTCLKRAARTAGITAGLVWPESGDECLLLYGDALHESDIRCIQPEQYTGEELAACLMGLQGAGLRAIAPITSRMAEEKMLRAAACAGVRPILCRMQGCEGLEGAVAASGCPVVLGAASGSGGSSWQLAARMDALHVPLALSCCAPCTSMKHLPSCASLYAREGLQRERALHLITSSPAEILGLRDVGRILPGYRADLVLYDGDPLLLSTSHVITILGGRVCC